LDVALFLLLGLDIATISVTRPETTGVHTGLHVHVIIGILLTIGCLVHIGLHWQWFQAVLTGKAKGKIKLVMNSMVTIMILLAGLSGHEALTSTAASNFHSFTGSMALIGLSIHSIKHMRWMASVTKRLITGNRQENIVQST
jgi:hypothetical protein